MTTDQITTQLTPMMQQYASVKKDFQDALVFYRLGDFYELFGPDAEIASKELGLVLTKRHDFPMCGIPWHASEMYISKLVKNGHRIAICEQLETPEEAKKRGGYKATVKREVTRVITQGTIIEQSMLPEKSNNFLMSIAISQNDTAIAYADISTGRFYIEEIKDSDLSAAITKVAPKEIICPDSLLTKKFILDSLGAYKSIIRPLPRARFMNNTAESRLAKFFGVKFIDAFGKLSKALIEASAAIVEYLNDVYKSDSINLSYPKLIKSSSYMNLDNFTRKSLELSQTQEGSKQWSLFNTIDRTETSQGGRMLARWLMEPLINIEKINKRLDYVEFFFNDRESLHIVKHILSNFPDLERSLSRILLNKAGPRDLRCIAVGLRQATELSQFVRQYNLLKVLPLTFDGMQDVLSTLDCSIVESPPMLARDGGFIRDGYDEELDEYRNILTNGEEIIQDLQKKYISLTGIPNLKIKSNSVIGYFIEVTPNLASKIPYSFTHRQSMANAIRYTSEELIDTANKIYSSESNAKRRELQILEDLIKKISTVSDDIRTISESISFLDVTTSFAKLAIDNNYVRPIITDDKTLHIVKGRHPVVEEALKKDGENFVDNDCIVSEESLMSILTGPNMGGKSTYLRQNALIIIMAQIGSFVPAESATIGVVDKIFSRVGASDDISSGRSTFMVEMIETATILQNATDRSFVILDEIGRGTSTYDGMAIAWATAEEIANKIKARTIFATHYHELVNLRETIQSLNFLTVDVKELNNQIVFLHKVTKGYTNKSYGLNVAALAGFPQRVLDRAKEVQNKYSGFIDK
ncbi:MAG: DNA mismatch repair protein MutS [Alphaproteobacteria bacterium]|nr:DNA mismatch repair protein MutS [Alphaproteobacteria bacterium]